MKVVDSFGSEKYMPVWTGLIVRAGCGNVKIHEIVDE